MQQLPGTDLLLYGTEIMMKQLIGAMLACIFACSISNAQPANTGAGPGPGPTPDPWIVNGNTITYPGQILSPTFVTPILGTPQSGNVVNTTGYLSTNLVGSISSANLPIATTSALGIVKIGTGLTISAGIVSPTFGTAANQVVQGGVITPSTAGSATITPIVTYNAAGQLTAVSSATITPAVGSITGLGSGVATALGVGIGSAGAPVLLNGVGGTPSSLTLTHATGLAISTGVSGLGTGVATLLGGTSSGTGGPAGTISPTFTGTLTGSAGAFSSMSVSNIMTAESIGMTSLSVGGASRATLLGYFPSLGGSAGAGFGWNYSSGGGETDLFINKDGGANGGLNIYDFPSSSGNPTLTASISVTGEVLNGLPVSTIGAIAVAPYVEPYLGNQSCTTDAASAVAAASAQAVASNGVMLIDRCYRISSNQTFAANIFFSNGGFLNIDSGVTVTLTGQIQAPDTALLFEGSGGYNTVVSNSSYASVAWWGGLFPGADPGPAFRSMFAHASNKTLIIPPGTYTFGSGTTGYIGATSPGGGLVSSLVFINGQSNFNVVAYGATISQSSSLAITGNCNCGIFMNNNNNFSWSGGTIVGVKSTVSGGPYTNAAFVNHNAVGFTFRDIHLTGNFGSPYNTGGGTGWAGDFDVNGTYQNIDADAVGLMFDFAFLSHVTIDNVRANGAGADGGSSSGDWGRALLSIEYDTASVGFNTTGITLTTSDNVTIENSRGGNFYYNFNLSDGTYFNAHDNYLYGGNASTPGYGIYIAWGGTGTVPTGWSFHNNTLSNFDYCFVTITSGVTSGDPFSNFSIGGGVMQECVNAAIHTTDSTGTLNSNIVIGPDIAYAGNGANVSGTMALVATGGLSKACTTYPTLVNGAIKSC